jgi:hypothetical protein
VRWWQWLLSIPKSVNPAIDSSGINAYINQPSDVIFLCQTLEAAKPTPYRKLVISRNKPIFMPIINWLSILHIDGETENELMKSAKERMDVIADLEMTINDVSLKEGLENCRARSPIFEIVFPHDNILGINEGPTLCYSDGYWIFLKPLANNTKISSFGSCSSGITQIAVIYDITVT